MRGTANGVAAVGLMGLVALVGSGCTPVVVRADEVAIADIAVPRQGEEDFNVLAVGTADAEGRIILRTTGTTVSRGETIDIGVMGPGILWGAHFMIVGIDVPVELIRFAATQGGGVDPQPAAVLRVTVPEHAERGLYSILVVRFGRYTIFTGGLEIT
ncbi:MAG: hypothetical protein P8R42_12215 [Candidatus Binatia bacterium]|nr:hypothetical protein [Candidatus Binatia bacterium]